MAKPPVSITDDAYFQDQPEIRTGLPEYEMGNIFERFLGGFDPRRYSVLQEPTTVQGGTISPELEGMAIYRPGVYKLEPGLGMPPALASGIDFFKQFMDEPVETAKAAGKGLVEGMGEEVGKAMVAVQTGKSVYYDPEKEGIQRLDPLSIIAPQVAVGFATAKSIARTAGDDGTVLGIMGGRRSKTGSVRENTAKSMQAMGKSPDDIFRSVGVFYDEDVLGKPLEAFRFEIPTGNSTLLPDATRTKEISYGSGEAFGLNEGFEKASFTSEGNLATMGGKRATLQEILDFPELYDEYPELRNVEVLSLQPTGDQNPFDLPVAAYAKPHESDSGNHQILIADFADPKEFQSALLHEVQHVVQYIESFPSGASAKEIFEVLRERYPDADTKTLEQLARQSYATVYGEAEARNVQRRFENPEEALLNPVETRRKEVADREVTMDELDAAGRVDEDAISQAAGIAPFGPLLGGGQESRSLPPEVTLRDPNQPPFTVSGDAFKKYDFTNSAPTDSSEMGGFMSAVDMIHTPTGTRIPAESMVRGHKPDFEKAPGIPDLDAETARRIMLGEITVDQARKELVRKNLKVVDPSDGGVARLLGGKLQESRPTDPVTIRSLGGGRGGIYGLAHGAKYADEEYNVPSDLEGLVFDDPARIEYKLQSLLPAGTYNLAAPVDKLVLDAGAVADIGSRRTVLGSELIEKFGFSNRIKDAITGQAAASAEASRPGFSIGTDPMLSYTQFTGGYGDINRLYAVEPQKKGYKATGEFDPETGDPIYKLTDITMQDVQNVSPAAYLVEAYDPEKPFSKKPNSAWMESEVHIHEDLSHGMKPRPLSPRERQDALATIEYEKRILRIADNAREDFYEQNNTRTIGDPDVDVFNLDKAFKQLNLAVNTPTPVGAMTQKQVDYTIVDFADKLALPRGLDTTVTRQRIIDNYGPAGENLIAALENYRKKRDITNNESLKNEVFNESALLKKRILNDSLTGDAKKFSDFLNINKYSGLEIDIPERYQYKFLSLGNARRNNDTAELKRLTDELTSGDYPAWDAITFIDDDGFLSFKGMPGSRVKLAERGVDLSGNPKQMTVEDFDIPLGVRNKIRQLSNKFMGRVPRDRFLEEVNQNVPLGYVDLVMQLFDTRHDRLVKFANGIDKEPVARQFNESFNQLKSARQDVADALRDVAAINPIRGTGNLPARIQSSTKLIEAQKRLLGSFYDDLFSSKAKLSEQARESVRKANIGPRPGAKLYEEGGAVRGPRIKSGIAGFVPYMVQ